MKRLIAILVAAVLLTALAAPTFAAKAEAELTVQITEKQLNDLVHLERPINNVSDIKFDVQEGRLGLIGIVDDPPVRVVMGILVSINNGKLVWTVMGASANDQYMSPEQLAFFNAQYPMSDGINEILGVFLRKYGTNLYFTAITLSNRTITLRFTRGGAPDAAQQPSAPKAPASVPAAQGSALANCSVTTTTNLNLRAEPSTQGTVITVVPLGTQLPATARQGSWYYVDFQGSQGWLNNGYLTKTGICR